MSVKTQAVDILNAKKLEQIQTVGAMFDTLIGQVQALPEDPDNVSLQQQLDDANTQLSTVKAALDADDAALTSEKAKEAKLQARLDAIKKVFDDSSDA